MILSEQDNAHICYPSLPPPLYDSPLHISQPKRTLGHDSSLPHQCMPIKVIIVAAVVIIIIISPPVQFGGSVLGQ